MPRRSIRNNRTAMAPALKALALMLAAAALGVQAAIQPPPSPPPLQQQQHSPPPQPQRRPPPPAAPQPRPPPLAKPPPQKPPPPAMPQPPPAPSQLQPQPASACVQQYAQCGGRSNRPAGVPDTDAAWACCADASFSCRRHNEHYWQCTKPPAGQPPPLAVHAQAGASPAPPPSPATRPPTPGASAPQQQPPKQPPPKLLPPPAAPLSPPRPSLKPSSSPPPGSPKSPAPRLLSPLPRLQLQLRPPPQAAPPPALQPSPLLRPPPQPLLRPPPPAQSPPRPPPPAQSPPRPPPPAQSPPRALPTAAQPSLSPQASPSLSPQRSPQPSPSPSPSPAAWGAGSCSLGRSAALYQQCGGQSDERPAGVAKEAADAPWACCGLGNTCWRKHQYYWQCRPDPNATAPAGTVSGPSALQLAPAQLTASGTVWYGDLTFYGKPGEPFKSACGEVMPGDGLYAALPDPLAFRLDSSGAYPASWCGGWRARRRPGRRRQAAPLACRCPAASLSTSAPPAAAASPAAAAAAAAAQRCTAMAGAKPRPLLPLPRRPAGAAGGPAGLGGGAPGGPLPRVRSRRHRQHAQRVHPDHRRFGDRAAEDHVAVRVRPGGGTGPAAGWLAGLSWIRRPAGWPAYARLARRPGGCSSAGGGVAAGVAGCQAAAPHTCARAPCHSTWSCKRLHPWHWPLAACLPSPASLRPPARGPPARPGLHRVQIS
jgi:hypothetical protein